MSAAFNPDNFTTTGTADPHTPPRTPDELAEEANAEEVPLFETFEDGQQCHDHDYGEEVWCVQDMIGDGWFVIISAKAKAGKSQAALFLAEREERKADFLGLPTAGWKVVYCNMEMTGKQMTKRWKRLCAAEGIEPPQRVYFIHAQDEKIKPTWQDLEKRLAAQFRKEGFNEDERILIIIDPLYALALGVEENSVKEMGPVMFALKGIAVRFGAVLLLHHTGYNDKRQRGSSVLEGAPDGCMVVEVENEIPKQSKRLKLTGEVRDGWEPLTIHLDLTTGQLSRIGGTPEGQSEKPGQEEDKRLLTPELFVSLFEDEPDRSFSRTELTKACEAHDWCKKSTANKFITGHADEVGKGLIKKGGRKDRPTYALGDAGKRLLKELKRLDQYHVASDPADKLTDGDMRQLAALFASAEEAAQGVPRDLLKKRAESQLLKPAAMDELLRRALSAELLKGDGATIPKFRMEGRALEVRKGMDATAGI